MRGHPRGLVIGAERSRRRIKTADFVAALTPFDLRAHLLPVLRLSVIVRFLSPRQCNNDDPSDVPAEVHQSLDGLPGPGSSLCRAINEVKTLRTGVKTPPYELKRACIDLEFALERNAKGGPSIIVFAADRRIEPKSVQKLRLKLSAREK